MENNCSRRSPYPGLRPFTEAESDLFFGREKHTAQLRSKLERNRFVAVVGSSGSGKSSLVRAGLIAQLKGLGDPDYAQTQTEGEQLRWRRASRVERWSVDISLFIDGEAFHHRLA